MSRSLQEAGLAVAARTTTRLPRLRIAAPAWVASSWPWVAPVLLALVTWRFWPVPGVTATAGLDPSWKIGLHLAAANGLHFGSEVVYTYGPLGFLTQPLAVEPLTSALAIAFSLAVWLALAAAVLAAAKRALPAPAALVTAYLVLCLPVQVADALVVLAFLAAVWTLERDPAPSSPLLVAAAGVYAAVVGLVKLNNGAVTLVLLAFAVWRLRPGRLASEGILLGSFGVSFVALWLATGNPVEGLPHWLETARHVVSGYAQTMAVEGTSRLSQDVWAACLVLAGLLLLALHLRRTRPALWLAAALYTYVFLKEGFVRHDAHDLTFFAAFGIGLLAFAWQGSRLRLLALATVLATVGAVLATPEIRLGDLVRPVASASAALGDARLVVDPGRLRAEISTGRTTVRRQLALDRRTLDLLRGRTVDVVPVEVSAAWAYGLRWRPEPVLQDFSAYDGYLDRLNARAIAEHGSQRILEGPTWPGVDETNPVLEAPATFLARLCHYRELRLAGAWGVLGRTGDRCGAPERIGSTTGRAGSPVAIPAAPRRGELVYAQIRLRPTFAEQLTSLVLKPLHLPRIVLGSTTYRFVSASADDPLVLRLPPGSGLSPWFGGSVDYGRFTLLNVPSPYEVEFYAVPLRGGTQPARTPIPVGRIAANALVLGGRRVPIVPGSVEGSVDASLDWGREGGVTGWAADPHAGVPADRVAVFVDGRLAALGRPSSARADVAASLHAPHALRSGFRVAFRLEAGAAVRVFGIARGRAAELGYGSGDAWPHA